jgi:hypothetical protein
VFVSVNTPTNTEVGVGAVYQRSQSFGGEAEGEGVETSEENNANPETRAKPGSYDYDAQQAKMKEIAAQHARQLQKERIKEQKAKASQAAGEAKETAKETKDSAAYQTKGTVQNLKGVGVFKPQVDVTSINDSINLNIKARGASNPVATFLSSADLVLEAPAPVDAQEVTPAAE